MPSQDISYREPRNLLSQVKTVGQASSPFDDINYRVHSLSWPAFFALVALAYLLLNLLFALLYVLVPGAIQGARPGSFEDAFFFSVQTFSTVGYGALSPGSRYGHALTLLELITSLLGTALVTGATFSRFSRPRARILFSDQMVMHRRNGQRVLEVRMANWRHNQLLEVEVRMLLLVNERTVEGELLRRQYELPLARQRTAFFWLTFTAMHPITDDSPLAGDDARERLGRQDASFMVTLSGTDETLSQGVHARCVYTLADIVDEARFDDVLSSEPDGTRVVDYRRFHRTLPEPLTATPPAPPR